MFQRSSPKYRVYTGATLETSESVLVQSSSQNTNSIQVLKRVEEMSPVHRRRADTSHTNLFLIKLFWLQEGFRQGRPEATKYPVCGKSPRCSPSRHVLRVTTDSNDALHVLVFSTAEKPQIHFASASWVVGLVTDNPTMTAGNRLHGYHKLISGLGGLDLSNCSKTTNNINIGRVLSDRIFWKIQLELQNDRSCY